MVISVADPVLFLADPDPNPQYHLQVKVSFSISKTILPKKKCCIFTRSGSGIGYFLEKPDPDPYPDDKKKSDQTGSINTESTK